MYFVSFPYAHILVEFLSEVLLHGAKANDALRTPEVILPNDRSEFKMDKALREGQDRNEVQMWNKLQLKQRMFSLGNRAETL